MKRKNLIYGQMYQQDKYVRKRFEIYQILIGPYLKKEMKVLDLGGYTGDFLRILPKGVDYTVVDIDEKALALAKKKGAKIIHLDLNKDKLSLKGRYDLIVVTEVLEHLQDPETVLNQIKKLLKKGGIVLVSLPNDNLIYHRFRVLMGKGIIKIPFSSHYHLHFPTIAQSKEFINRFFRIKETRYWVHLGEGKMEKYLSLVPYPCWQKLAEFSPGLFARGVIFLGEKK